LQSYPTRWQLIRRCLLLTILRLCRLLLAVLLLRLTMLLLLLLLRLLLLLLLIILSLLLLLSFLLLLVGLFPFSFLTGQSLSDARVDCDKGVGIVGCSASHGRQASRTGPTTVQPIAENETCGRVWTVLTVLCRSRKKPLVRQGICVLVKENCDLFGKQRRTPRYLAQNGDLYDKVVQGNPIVFDSAFSFAVSSCLIQYFTALSKCKAHM
jgi:hypothetical protein